MITFRGEKRPASDIRVDATAEAEHVDGYLAAVRAETLAEGADVKATTRAKDLLPGAAAICRGGEPHRRALTGDAQRGSDSSAVL